MPEPTKIPRAFAASGDKNSIPDSSGSPGFASWQEGFPAITSEPFAQGGIAPKRADFNGIFNALSLATLWQQQGGFYAYDATTDYEVGNVVEYSGDLYKCITANGPGSAVKAPTDTTVWAKVILTTATTSAAGYMSATDKAALDDAVTIKTGSLSPSSIIDATYSTVSSSNRVGIFKMDAGLKNGALANWSKYHLYTSSIKPAALSIGEVTFQSGPQSGIFLQIETDGKIYLRTTGGTVPSSSDYYHGTITFFI